MNLDSVEYHVFYNLNDDLYIHFVMFLELELFKYSIS